MYDSINCSDELQQLVLPTIIQQILAV